jgi:hypothetical protein
MHIYQSEALVRFVAEVSGVEEDPGITGTWGSLASISSRAAVVRDLTHRVVYHSTPTQRSWLTQGESWLRIVVHTFLTYGSLLSIKDEQATVLAFSVSCNRTMARSFTGTSHGRAL